MQPPNDPNPDDVDQVDRAERRDVEFEVAHEVADFIAGLFANQETYSPSHRLVAREVARRVREKFGGA